MPKPAYARCKNCGAHRDEVGYMSRRQYCTACGQRAYLENLEGIHAKSGPAFLRWRRGMIACALDPTLMAALDASGIFDPVDENKPGP